MKRHISIFAFLLGAFVAIEAVAAERQYVMAECYWPADKNLDWDGYMWNEAGVMISPWEAYVGSGESVTFSASPEKGWAVDHWRKIYGKNFSQDMQNFGEPIANSSSVNCVWRHEADQGSVHLGVRFKWLSYNLKYDYGGGSKTGSDSREFYTNSFHLADAPAKTGYTFRKWKASSNGVEFDAGASVTGADLCLDTWHEDGHDVTNVAQWTENSYAISSSGENCTVTVSKTTGVKYTETVTVSWNPQTPPGHTRTFKSAKVLAGETELKSFTSGTSGTFTMSAANKGYFESVTVEVVYEDATNQYHVNVTSGGNGSVSKTPDQPKYDYGSTMTISATPDDGYAFASWSDGGAQAHDVTVGAEDVTYTATFTNRIFTLTWNANGGTFADGSSVSNVPMAYRSSFGEMPMATQVTKVLDGWHRDKTAWSPVVSGDQYTWNLDMTLYAHWKDEERYSVIVRAEPTEGGTVTGGGESQFRKGDKVTLTAMPNAGYRFVEWNDGERTSIREVTVSGNVEYTARFQGFYTVTYVAGEATSGEMDAQAIYRDEETALTSNAFKRTGYAFLGWAETNDLRKVKYLDGTNVLNIAKAGDTNELHAVWSANRYRVRFDAGGGSGTMDDQAFVYDQPQNLSPCTFDRGEFWKFVGWTNEVAQTSYTNGEEVINLTADQDGIVTLTAVWKTTLSDLSLAMGCDNLIWENESGWPDNCGWVPGDGGVTNRLGSMDIMNANLSTNGVLRFSCLASDEATIYVQWYEKGGAKIRENALLVKCAPNVPEVVSVDVSFGAYEPGHISIWHDKYVDETLCLINDMTWTPAGSEPKRGKPVVAIAAGVEDGVFSLTIPTIGGINYGVWTNADLTVPAENWGLMETKKAEGDALDFSFEIVPGFQQLFFRAYEVK